MRITTLTATVLCLSGCFVFDNPYDKTPAAALQIVDGHEGAIDLLLTDVIMPGMSGLAACRDIRADKNIAIIMLTVRDSEADKVAALDAGADDFITKPFSTPELLARIRAALRRVPVSQFSPPRLRIAASARSRRARSGHVAAALGAGAGARAFEGRKGRQRSPRAG
ncbi:MAG: response regulator transcription factor [Dehalococcoidia bacterium]